MFFFFDFYGRDNELKELNNLYNKNGFKFVVVYGRRRVGKSSLIQKFIDEYKKPNISFMALEQNDKQNLDAFSKVVLDKYSSAKSYLTSFPNWEKVFEYIIMQAEKEKLIIFIDEFPYLANSNPSISSILQKYIDNSFKATNITLILCGSSMSFMEQQVLGHKSPLYGRRDMQFKVEPFDYFDSAKFFDNWSNEDKVLAYAVTGGIPQYLNKLKAYSNISDGIKNEFLKKNGSLYEEPRNLLLQELREPAVYNTIIRAIASGASKLNEISTKAGEDGKKISKYLNTLITLHIVRKEFPMFNNQERNGIYKVYDNMFRFWYRFVAENNMNIEAGMVDYVYDEKILQDVPNYMGLVFEDICIQYLIKQNKAFSLPIVFNDIGRWWGSNSIRKCQEEIDIIAISNNTAIFGECKWKNLAGIETLKELKRKAELFKQFDNKYYYIFAKGSFAKPLIEAASQDDFIKLVSLKDIYN